jgi:hypothetical protein
MTPANVSRAARSAPAARSWISPGGGKQWLLYVSDESSNTVDIYNYRAKPGKLFGQITGLTHPLGQCVDSAGNVYVTAFRDNEILEYAHGGITPVAAAYDYYGRPDGCAVDPTTGNIAVTNSVTLSTQGNILVFSGGLGGNQTLYYGSDQQIDTYDPPAYDPQGNLFFEGYTFSAQAIFGELPAGSSTMQLISGLNLTEPAAVQWDGAYIAAVDPNYQNSGVAAIYRVTVSGSAATVVRTTVLTDTCTGSGYNYASIYQPYIGGTTRKLNTVVSGNTSVTCSNRLNFWNYTTGGNPKRVMPADISPVTGSGTSVSPPAGS